ncbi:GTP-binding protein [Nocardia pseudobrasiliensis]|uniref:Ribosomal protection tetracycline resistance protein n=1 Tax=Nocardia pseudobrasiliensis TaxID=45979 RepID=A0A370IDT6_9NOCA|nr:GTP-binding protein [Nocardia pseudobrasiliensis]RDI68888.1 ribosomal protection tetracycline resistance protein [Nocardia pseudobrasiliensis]
MPIHRTLNIGIVAHVDAGKTSLTERLLYDTGAIDTLGSVDAGTTRTDTGDIERQRGITVRSAVVSFTVGDIQVNVIDTPGHSDFVAEVDRALRVLDAAVLVISAVEGVQAHTRTLMRILRDMRLPTLIFVNKIDRPNARPEQLLAEIAWRVTPYPLVIAEDLADIAETLAEQDDSLLAALVDGPPPTPATLQAALRDQLARGLVHPVYFGSALTGHGVDALIRAITELLPIPESADGPTPRGTIFAVERSASGAKTAYLRLFSGTVTTRDRLALSRRDYDGTTVRHTGRITTLRVVGGGSGPLTAGNIGRITGPSDLRVGDTLGVPTDSEQPRFAVPTLRTLVRARTGTPAALHAALRQLAEQDPLLHIRVEPDGDTSILLYGEIQREIIATTLSDRYGIDAEFLATEPLRVERVTGTGAAIEEMGYRAASSHGFWATVGLRVDPGPPGTTFRYETELGALPRAFHCAIAESVHATLRRGTDGRPITDCVVTLIRSGFAAPISTAADFRGLTPLVLTQALRRAGTEILEPTDAFELDLPADTLAPVLTALIALGASIQNSEAVADAWRLTGTIATRAVDAVRHRLPALTRGEADWWSRPAGYR